MNTKIFHGLVIFIFAILLLYFLWVIVSSQQKTEVRVGYLIGDLHHLPFFVALEKGYFKEAGIDVKVVGPFEAGTVEMEALATNQMDIGYVGASPAIIAAARGVNLSIIAGVNKEGSSLIVDKSIDDVEELKNKKIATPLPGSIQYILFGMLLAENNMSYQDIDILPGTIKPPDMPSTLERGNIKGYIVWEPYASQSVVAGIGKRLIDSNSIWPEHPCCVLVIRNDFKEKNPEIVKRIVEAHKKAIEFIKNNPIEAKKIAVKYTKLNMNVIEEALPRIKFDYSIEKNSIRRFVEETIKLGESEVVKPIIKTEEIQNITEFVDKIVDLKFIS